MEIERSLMFITTNLYRYKAKQEVDKLIDAAPA